MKILIVDDDVDMLFMGQRLLNKAGHAVSVLSHCDLLFNLLEQARPDLIILDINLGECNGISLCRKIKRNIDYSGIVILLYSSDSHDQSVCLSCNANYFIQKPFKREVLVNIVAEYNL